MKFMPENSKLLKGAAAAGVAGLGAWWFLGRVEPKAIPELAERMGGYFIIILAGLYLFYRIAHFIYWLADGFISTQRDVATSLGRLSGAVETIAQRDDARGRENEVLLGHIGRKVDSLSAALEEQFSELAKHLDESVRFGGQFQYRLTEVEKQLGLRTAESREGG